MPTSSGGIRLRSFRGILMPVICRSGGFVVLKKPHNMFKVVFVPKDDVLHYFGITGLRDPYEDVRSPTPVLEREGLRTSLEGSRLEVERIPLVTLDNVVLRSKSGTHHWYLGGSIRRANIWMDPKGLLSRSVPINRSYINWLRSELPCRVFGLRIVNRTITVVWNEEVYGRGRYAKDARSSKNYENLRVFLLYNHLPIIVEGGVGGQV